MSDPASSEPAPLRHDPYAALRNPAYRAFFLGNIFALLGMQMQSVAVGWEIYRRTNSKIALGYVGLVQFLPVLLLALPAGQVADWFERKRIVQFAMLALGMGSLGLLIISFTQADVRWMYACLLWNGVAKAFQQPAKASLLPQLVPREHFSNAVTWNSSGFQFACIVGPALAGMQIALFKSAAIVYATEATSTLTFLVILTSITIRPQVRAPIVASLRSLQEGFSFVWRNKIVLGTLALDLFAVLLGGATTLLPVFADDVLNVESSLGWLHQVRFLGFTGASLDLHAVALGLLRTSPAIGALLMSVGLAHLPPLKYAGRTLLWSVAGFGVATVCFGLSRSLWLSAFMLLLTGALDMISVVIRHTLVQLLTPDELRGRVSAVNGMFIGASNELGGFESGVVAEAFEQPGDRTFGPMMSVVTGGLGTLLVVAFVALRWPQLRRFGRLDSAKSS